MNVRHVCKWSVVSVLLVLGLGFGLNKALVAQPGPAGAEQGVEVLTRGPVHEAFAETVTFDPEPGIVTPKAPPAAIEEVPPEQRLEGGPTSRGFPVIGAGTTSEPISFGSAAFGGPCRPVANGCPAIGASRGRAINGLPGTGPMPRRAR